MTENLTQSTVEAALVENKRKLLLTEQAVEHAIAAGKVKCGWRQAMLLAAQEQEIARAKKRKRPRMLPPLEVTGPLGEGAFAVLLRSYKSVKVVKEEEALLTSFFGEMG